MRACTRSIRGSYTPGMGTFGTSDFTARISAATFGVILMLLPAFLRKELGRVGALIVSALTLISPSTLYYARYIRNG